jgi:NAD+ synthetase
MRDYKIETEQRVEFIRNVLEGAHSKGIVFGNSGGKDCTLVGILCKMACENTLGIIMPCGSKQNYGSDKTDAEITAEQFNIDTKIVDLSKVKEDIVNAMKDFSLTDAALANIAPRLRMTTLYSVAASENRLVAGTGNKSEVYMGYFTKWGDGAYDFNPIGDLTVTEVYEFLRYLNAPSSIIDKEPSAGLFDGQTDEKEMGVTYKSIDEYIQTGETDADSKEIIDRYHRNSEHKRRMPLVYGSK